MILPEPGSGGAGAGGGGAERGVVFALAFLPRFPLETALNA